MSAYARGRAFEYRVRDHFKRLGYLVSRSPQSRSPFDLIVIGHQAVLLVQCKVGGALGPKGWNELYDLAIDTAGAQPILVTREKRKMCFYRMLARKDKRGRQPMAICTFGSNENDAWIEQAANRLKTRGATSVVIDPMQDAIEKENAHQLAS